MQSGSWFIYFIIIAIVSLAVILIIYFISDANYDTGPKNTFTPGQTIYVRSLEADSHPLALSTDCHIPNNNPKPYKNACIVSFTGGETDTWTLSLSNPIVPDPASKINLSTSVDVQRGNRMFMTNNTGSPTVALLSEYSDKRNRYIVGTRGNTFDNDESPLLAPFFQQENGVAGVSRVSGSSSDALYRIVFPHKGINSSACDYGVSQDCANSGTARLRPAPRLSVDPFNTPVNYDRPGLAVYDTDLTREVGVELEYLFRIELTENS